MVDSLPAPDPAPGAPDVWHTRRLPADDTLGGPDFGRLVAAMRLLQTRLNAASPPDDVVAATAERLEAIAADLAPYEVPEGHGPVGRREDLPGRGNPLLPPVVWEERSAEVARGRVVFSRYYLGGNGAAHGGTIPLLFDEVLGRLANSADRPPARTAYLHVNYRNITPIDRELVIEARYEREEGRKRWSSGRLLDGDLLLADAEGLFVQLLPGQP
jgi:hypothetical protein